LRANADGGRVIPVVQNVFRPWNVKIFPNGEVFLVSCDVTTDAATWHVPPSPLDAGIEVAIFNRDYLPDFARLPPLRNNGYLRSLKTKPFCAGVIEGDAILSVCFHHGNGALTVDTDPEHRRKENRATLPAYLDKEADHLV
jgi:hypothetical protein